MTAAGIYSSPATYAKHIAGYIKDDSKVYAYTAREFGRAPSIDRIRELRAEIEAKRKRQIVAALDERFDDDKHYAYQRPRNVAPPAPEPEPEKPAFVWQQPAVTPVTWKEFAASVAASFRYSLDDVMGRRKFDDLVRVRQLIFVLLIERGNARAQIGRWFGRDHTTVMHAEGTFPKRLASDPEVAQAYAHFSKRAAA